MHSPYTRDPNDLRYGPVEPMDQPRLKWGWVILCSVAAWVVAGLIAALLLGGW